MCNEQCARKELEEIKKFLEEIGVKNTICTCGSGGHPRKCERHPDRYTIHCLELDNENLRKKIKDLEEKAKEFLDALNQWIDD